MSISRTAFGQTPDGAAVDLYALSNGLLSTEIITFGGRVVSLYVPDRAGKRDDVVLGCDRLEPYLQKNFFGAIVGRYANRIAGAQVTLNGVVYLLPANAGAYHIHGGVRGFDKVVWRAEAAETTDGPQVRLVYLSRDGEEGYPGNLHVTVAYTLTADALAIAYEAVCDKDTIINLTNHSFFNLGGHASGDVLGHELTLCADAFTVCDEQRLPTGEIRSVAGTPMDFRQPTVIGSRINADDEQVRFGRGFDHNWVLNHAPGVYALAADVYDAKSGRLMEVYTTEPGVHFYSGNALSGSIVGKGGVAYVKHAGLCLEVQHFPDSPRHPHFPSVILRAGERYTQRTSYRFATR
jgi:aldose 1-epimerase